MKGREVRAEGPTFSLKRIELSGDLILRDRAGEDRGETTKGKQRLRYNMITQEFG